MFPNHQPVYITHVHINLYIIYCNSLVIFLSAQVYEGPLARY